MINLINGGNRNNWYRIVLFIPVVSRNKIQNLHGKVHTCTKIEFNTTFSLTSNNSYCSMEFRILGFGLGIELQSKE